MNVHVAELISEIKDSYADRCVVAKIANNARRKLIDNSYIKEFIVHAKDYNCFRRNRMTDTVRVFDMARMSGNPTREECRDFYKTTFAFGDAVLAADLRVVLYKTLESLKPGEVITLKMLTK